MFSINYYSLQQNICATVPRAFARGRRPFETLRHLPWSHEQYGVTIARAIDHLYCEVPPSGTGSAAGNRNPNARLRPHLGSGSLQSFGRPWLAVAQAELCLVGTAGRGRGSDSRRSPLALSRFSPEACHRPGTLRQACGAVRLAFTRSAGRFGRICGRSRSRRIRDGHLLHRRLGQDRPAVAEGLRGKKPRVVIRVAGLDGLVRPTTSQSRR